MALLEHTPVNNENLQNIQMIKEILNVDGSTLRYVHVDDISQESETRGTRQAAIRDADIALENHPDWAAPYGQRGQELELNNPVSEWVYESSQTMREWRTDLVPYAVALIPMQLPFITHLPYRLAESEDGELVIVGGGGEVDDEARSFFIDALDSIGIRTRAKIMADIAQKYVHPDEVTEWISLACGAAIPVFEALKAINSQSASAYLHLVDIDRGSLATASQLAAEYGLEENKDFLPRKHDLISEMIVSDSLVVEFGQESAMMVDALGIFEYFNDKRSVQFLANAYKLVKPGGALVIANMLSDRPELAFNRRGIGWPKIYPRSLETIYSIVDEAEISRDNITVTIPEDGIYAVVEIKK